MFETFKDQRSSKLSCLVTSILEILGTNFNEGLANVTNIFNKKWWFHTFPPNQSTMVIFKCSFYAPNLVLGVWHHLDRWTSLNWETEETDPSGLENIWSNLSLGEATAQRMKAWRMSAAVSFLLKDAASLWHGCSLINSSLIQTAQPSGSGRRSASAGARLPLENAFHLTILIYFLILLSQRSISQKQ